MIPVNNVLNGQVLSILGREKNDEVGNQMYQLQKVDT